MKQVCVQITIASDEAERIVWKAQQGMFISPKSGSSSSIARLGKDVNQICQSTPLQTLPMEDRVYSQNTASEEEGERIPDVYLDGWISHRGN